MYIKLEDALNICEDSGNTCKELMDRCLKSKRDDTLSAYAYFAQKAAMYDYDIPGILRQVTVVHDVVSRAEYKKMCRENEALKTDLRAVVTNNADACGVCKSFDGEYGSPLCDECKTQSKWEWRGVQE